jgi:hypothetical protein
MEPLPMSDDADRVFWMSETLQGYSIGTERAEQLAAELKSLRTFIAAKAKELVFEDEPSTFRATQTSMGAPDVD